MDSRPQIRLRARAGTGLAMFMRRKGFNPTQGATGKVATHPARAVSGNALSPEAACDRRHQPAPDRERSGRPKVALPMRQPWCRWYGRPALPLHKDSALASTGFRPCRIPAWWLDAASSRRLCSPDIQGESECLPDKFMPFWPSRL